jgi:hypothetical protein
MRNWMLLLLGVRYRAALLPCVLVLACSPDAPTPTALDPVDHTAHEVVPVEDRLSPDNINAHAYGSFRVDGGTGTPAVITSGPANFPGKPKGGPGTCVNGLWYNSNGKPTSGSLTKPHPHCIRPAAAIELVLEPISACYTGFENPAIPCKGAADNKGFSFMTATFDNRSAKVTGAQSKTADPSNTVGVFTMTAYAIDATTLGTTNKRVGTLTIDLTQYTSAEENFFKFDEDGNPICSVDPAQPSPCINKVISAKYNPLPPPNGLGPTDFSVSGFLWVTPASSPYNYSDDLVGYVCPQQWNERFPHLAPPVLDIFQISTPTDAQNFAGSYGTSASEKDEIYLRVLVLAGVLLPGTGPNPCLADVTPPVWP